VSDSEILLAVPLWLTWVIRPEGDSSATRAISNVSVQRLRALTSRFQSSRELDADIQVHQLVRFNLLNFGEQSVAVSAITLTSLRGEKLSCDVVPAVVVAAGARYPFVVEVTTGPVSEAVDVEVDVNGRRISVPTQSLPRS